MRVISGVLATLMLSLLAIGSAHSQELKKGTLTGEILSAAADVPGGTTGTVLIVPSDRFYVMTQSCLGFGMLFGTQLGRVVNSATCTSYTPGIVFQAGEEILFTAGSTFPGAPPSSATITGVLVKTGGGGDHEG